MHDTVDFDENYISREEILYENQLQYKSNLIISINCPHPHSSLTIPTPHSLSPSLFVSPAFLFPQRRHIIVISLLSLVLSVFRSGRKTIKINMYVLCTDDEILLANNYYNMRLLAIHKLRLANV